jgi:hypothetical protein
VLLGCEFFEPEVENILGLHGVKDKPARLTPVEAFGLIFY